MINDVSRAYFYALATRDLYIDLPKEYPEFGSDRVGKLNLSLYGTRDAAKNWQKTLTAHLMKLGFSQGEGHPAIFVHRARDIWVLVHGDDYCSTGESEDLKWFE